MRAACAVLLLAACSEPQDPVCQVAQVTGDTYLTVGQEVTVRAGLAVSCFIPNVFNVDRELKTVKEVEVEVLDPDNRRVMARASALARDGGNAQFVVTTDVSFSYDRPGPWTVIARFEPNVGRTQQLVRGLDVRTDAGVRELPTALPMSCGDYGLTASGVPVCVVANPVNPDTELLIGNQRIAGTRFAIDGEAIWAMVLRKAAEGPGLERYGPGDAGAWVQTHRFEVTNTGLSDVLFSAGGGSAWVFQSSFTPQGVERLEPGPDGGGTRTMLSIGANRFPLGVAPAAERTIVLAQGNNGAGVLVSFLPDGGAEVMAAGAPGAAISSGDGLLWFMRGGGSQATLVAFDGTGDAVRTSTIDVVSNSAGFVAADLSPSVPVVRVVIDGAATRAVVPVFGAIELGVEAFEPGAGYGEVVSATRHHAFARSTDGTKLKVFDR